jgi:hypothetical protein
MINHKKKFLYTHYPKCAGTSIRSYFISNYKEGIDEEIEHKKNRHCSLDLIIERLIELNHDPKEYFKFSFARNPFDICLSFYSFHTTNNYERFKRLGKPPSKAVSFCLNHSFKDYIKSKHCFSYFDRIYTYNNVFSIDFIIRQENLENDFLKLCQTLKLKEIKLEKRNQTNHGNYRHYYDKESIKIVEEKFEKELNYFNYSF